MCNRNGIHIAHVKISEHKAEAITERCDVTMDDEELNPFEVLRAPIRYCFSLVKETDEHTTYVRNPGDRAAQQALCDKIRSLRHENPADDEEVKHNAMIDSGVRSIEEYHASELDEDSAWDQPGFL